ncbi:MAG: hypothetical protein LBK71_12195 [Verrucomicrobiales bacterium]|nr:hypothetical protein [Verrucomicrobiales bacterium]
MAGHLLNNNRQISLLNLQHEMAHQYLRMIETLAPERIGELRELWRSELRDQAGPLFANGELRKDVAHGVDTNFREWFAERMAWANHKWAEGRIEPDAGLPAGATFIDKLAYEFRRLLDGMLRLLRRDADGDELVKGFRDFLRQGERWQTPPAFKISAHDPPLRAVQRFYADAYRQNFDLWRRGKLDRQYVFQLGDTDGAMSLAGLPERVPVVMRQEVLQRKPNEQRHIYPVEKLRNLPDLLHNPVLIHRSWTLPNSYLVILDETHNGEHFSVALRLMVQNGVVEIADVRSIYPRNNNQIVAAFERGAVTYYDRKKTQALLEAIPSRFNRSSSTSELLGSVKNVANDGDLVKWENARNAEMEFVQRGDGSEEFSNADELNAELDARDAAERAESRDYADGDDFSGVEIPELARQPRRAADGEDINFNRDLHARADRADVDFAALSARIKNYEAILAQIQDRIRRTEGAHELNPRYDLEELRKQERAMLADLANLRAKRDDLVIKPTSAAVTSPSAAEPAAPAPVTDGPLVPRYSEKAKKAREATHKNAKLRRALEGLKDFLKGWRGQLPELPVFGKAAAQYAMFKEGHRLMKAAGAAAQLDARAALDHILQPMKGADAHGAYTVFKNVLYWRDLFYRSRQAAPGTLTDAEGNLRTLKLPYDMTPREVQEALMAAHAELAAHPQRETIDEALRRHYEFIRRETDDLAQRGYIIPDDMRNPFYFPHKVLKHWSGKIPNVALHAGEDFRGYLIPLKGTAEEHESDYVKAMFTHMVEVMTDNRHMDLVKKFWQPYDIKPQLEKDALKLERQNQMSYSATRYRALIPDGYREVEIDSRILLQGVDVIDRQKLAARLDVALTKDTDFKKLVELAGGQLKAGDIKQLFIPADARTWVLPAPVADALEGLVARETAQPHGAVKFIDQALGTLQWLWKRNTLFNPAYVFRYTFNNFVSDFEKIYTADPQMMKNLKPAYEEMWRFCVKGEKAPSKNFTEAFEKGVMQSVTALEASEAARLGEFNQFTTNSDILKKLLTAPVRGGRALFEAGMGFNRFREGVFRYAKYLTDIDRINNNADPYFGGSVSADVRELIASGLKSEAAAKIARETFVDYDAISVNGDALRKRMIPFFSWTEGNTRYHLNVLRNMWEMLRKGELSGVDLTAALAVKGAGMTVRGTTRLLVATGPLTFALRLVIPWLLVQAWNHWVMGDEEDDLSEEDKRRFHLTLGRNEKGEVELIYTPTAFADVLEWFGGGEFARVGMKVLNGELTLMQGAEEYGRVAGHAAVNKLASSLGPVVKVPYEYFSKKATFPDVTDQRSIPAYRMKAHILQQFLGNGVSDWVMRALGKDYYQSKDFGEWFKQLVLQVRARDPETWAYYSIREKVEEWNLAHHNLRGDPGTRENDLTPLVAAFRKALYRGDGPNTIRFYQRLVEQGYTAEQFAALARNQSPLAGVRSADRKAFVESLTPRERKMLDRAFARYASLAPLGDDRRGLFPSQRYGEAYKKHFQQHPAIAKVEKYVEETQKLTNAKREKIAERLLQESLRPKR